VTAKKKPPPAKSTPTSRRREARDALMIARVHQGWTWEAIAGEAGISVSAAKRAVAARKDSLPIKLNADPVRVIEQVFEGYQLSIGDFEAIGAAALEKGQLAVAVGAKKGANEAREKIVLLLQATGRLPQELGALRHLIDLRAIAVRMLDTVDGLERELLLIDQIEDPEARSRAMADATAKVRTTFNELIGVEPAALEGSAVEQ
jgi:hypothetical protein